MERETQRFFEKMENLRKQKKENEYEVYLNQGDVFIRHKNHNGDSDIFLANPLDILSELLKEKGFDMEISNLGAFDSPHWDE